MRTETNPELAEKIKRIALDLSSEEKAILEEGALRLVGGSTTPPPDVNAGVEIGPNLAEQIVVLVGGNTLMDQPREISAIFSGEFTPGELPIYQEQPCLALEEAGVDEADQPAPVDAVGEQAIETTDEAPLVEQSAA